MKDRKIEVIGYVTLHEGGSIGSGCRYGHPIAYAQAREVEEGKPVDEWWVDTGHWANDLTLAAQIDSERLGEYGSRIGYPLHASMAHPLRLGELEAAAKRLRPFARRWQQTREKYGNPQGFRDEVLRFFTLTGVKRVKCSLPDSAPDGVWLAPDAAADALYGAIYRWHEAHGPKKGGDQAATGCGSGC